MSDSVSCQAPKEPVKCTSTKCDHKIIGYAVVPLVVYDIWCPECAEAKWQSKD